MALRNALRAIAVVAGMAGLAACQTTTMTPVSAQQAASLYSGTWSGHFINRQGTRYPVTWNLTEQNGQLSGRASIPDSTFDKTPSLSGSYQGNRAQVRSSSEFVFDMTMSVAEDGSYRLTGPVTGPNSGWLELRRQ